MPLPLAGSGRRVMLLGRTSLPGQLSSSGFALVQYCLHQTHNCWLCLLRVTILLKVFSLSSPDPLGSCLEPRGGEVWIGCGSGDSQFLGFRHCPAGRPRGTCILKPATPLSLTSLHHYSGALVICPTARGILCP